MMHVYYEFIPENPTDDTCRLGTLHFNIGRNPRRKSSALKYRPSPKEDRDLYTSVRAFARAHYVTLVGRYCMSDSGGKLVRHKHSMFHFVCRTNYDDMRGVA